jgi:hypothetical protein
MNKFVTRAAVVTAAVGAVLTVAPGPASAQRNYYGAIAISFDSGNIGYSYDYGDVGSAKNRAINGCGYGDCQSVVWFSNGCGAVAYAPGGYWSWSYGRSRGAAQSSALGANRGSGAYIVHWNCTSNHG